MYSIDPQFKMSYDLRNDQETSVRRQRRSTTTHDADHGSDSETKKTSEATCDIMGSKGMRWACLTGLALLGAGVGYQLGRDQYGRFGNP